MRQMKHQLFYNFVFFQKEFHFQSELIQHVGSQLCSATSTKRTEFEEFLLPKTKNISHCLAIFLTAD